MNDQTALNEELENTEEERFIPSPVTVARATMIGDIRDMVLDIIRDKRYTGKAWKDMNEAEQKSVANMVSVQAEEAVARAVDIIHSDGQRHIKAILKQVTVKDGYKAVFEMSAHDELRHELVDAQGDSILVVLADHNRYAEDVKPVKIDKDQPELNTGDEHHDGQERSKGADAVDASQSEPAAYETTE